MSRVTPWEERWSWYKALPQVGTKGGLTSGTPCWECITSYNEQQIYICTSLNPVPNAQVCVFDGTYYKITTTNYISKTSLYTTFRMYPSGPWSLKILMFALLVTREIATYSWPWEKTETASATAPGSTSWGFRSQEEGDCCSRRMESHRIPSAGLDGWTGWMTGWMDGKSFTTTTSFTICN